MSEATPERAARIFNGKYTVKNGEGDHRTFRIKTMESAAKQKAKRPNKQPFAPDKRVISLLTGSDNQRDYTNFGFVDDDGIRVWQSFGGTTGRHHQYARMLWDLLTTENGFYAQRGYTVDPSCTCVRCNKELTNPISILTGIGPECSGRGSKRKRNKFRMNGHEITPLQLSQTL
jgi:hypothetical protein